MKIWIPESIDTLVNCVVNLWFNFLEIIIHYHIYWTVYSQRINQNLKYLNRRNYWKYYNKCCPSSKGLIDSRVEYNCRSLNRRLNNKYKINELCMFIKLTISALFISQKSLDAWTNDEIPRRFPCLINAIINANN